MYSGSLQTSGPDLGGSGYHGNNSTILVSDTLMADSNGTIRVDLSVSSGGGLHEGRRICLSGGLIGECSPQNGEQVAWRYAYGSSYKFIKYSESQLKQSLAKQSVSGTIDGEILAGTQPEYLKVEAINGLPSVKQLEHAVISSSPSSNYGCTVDFRFRTTGLQNRAGPVGQGLCKAQVVAKIEERRSTGPYQYLF